MPKRASPLRPFFPIGVVAMLMLGLFFAQPSSPNQRQTSILGAFDGPPFDDVPLDHAYVDPIAFLKDFGVIKGYGDGTFGPENSLTRAEFLKVIILGTGMELENVPAATEAPFPDVALDDWFVDYVAYGADHGFLVGYSDGTFRPDETINKVEVLKILAELVEWDLLSIDTDTVQNPYTDLNLDAWYGPYVAYGIEHNLFDDSGSTFDPGAAITRGQMTEYLYRDYVVRELDVDRYEYDYDVEILGYDRQTNPGGFVVAEDDPELLPIGTVGDEDEYEWVKTLIYEEVLADNPYLDTLVAFMEPVPYPAGIELGIYDVTEDDGVRDEVTLPGDYWVAFVDLEPQAEWEHPTLLVLVNAATYDVETTAFSSWPTYNGVLLWATHDMREQTDLWIYPTDGDLNRLYADYDAAARLSTDSLSWRMDAATGDFEPSLAQELAPEDPYPDTYEDVTSAELQELRELYGDRTVEDFASPCPVPNCDEEGKKIAIVVDGRDDEDLINMHNPEDYKWQQLELYQGLVERGYDTTYVTSYIGEDKSAVPEGADPDDFSYATLDSVRQAFVDAAAQIESCCDEVLVFIHGHGSPDGYLSINPRKRLANTEWQRVTNSDGSRQWKKVITGYRENGDVDGGYLSTEDLRELFNLLKTCQVYVFIESCYAGIHLENGINEETPTDACLCRSVYTSTSKHRPSWGSWLDRITEGFINGESVDEAVFAAAELVETQASMFSQAGHTGSENCDDTDGDGVCDGIERSLDMDPSSTDTDDDGVPDGDEWRYDPEVPDRLRSPDDPTSPTDDDTDDDKLPDGEERDNGTDPFDTDSDDDEVSDWTEVHGNMDPLDPDTDDDGCDDGQEIDEGTNPLDPDSKGLACSESPVVYEINPELRQTFEIEGHTLQFGWMGYETSFDLTIDGTKRNFNYGESIDLGNGVTITVEWNADHTAVKVTVTKGH